MSFSEAIQEEKESELLSYFRIGGIHALPYVAWDNVGESGKGGYCAHGTVLFPTWHRVYVSLYEVSALQLDFDGCP